MSHRPVVFDCDGVLVDSETLGWQATGIVLARYGIAITDDDIEQLTGAPFSEDYAHFSSKGSLPALAEFERELSHVMFELFDQRLEAFEDAKDTLEELLRRQVPLAVASNSGTERLSRTLRATSLEGLFSIAVSADDVDHPKPAPDLYVRAAELLGVEPQRCVAVEDTATGVTAAVAAGMWTVLVDRTGGADHHGADVVVPRLTPATVLYRDPLAPGGGGGR